MRPAFAYTRVSTDDQVQNHSLLGQAQAIERYAAEHGYHIVDRFEDDGYSGMSMDRPAMRRMLARIEREPPDAILYDEESRWSRGSDGPPVRDRLRAQGVRVVAVSDGAGDADDYLGSAGEDALGLVARDHIRRLQATTPGRMRVAVVNGTKPVGGRAPWGYLDVWGTGADRKVRTIVPDPDRAPLILRAFTMYIEGASTGDVAEMLRPAWPNIDASSVSRVLQNIRYAGHNRIGNTSKKKRGGVVRTVKQPRSAWTVRRDTHEAIVTDEMYDKVQAMLDAAGADARRTSSSQDRSPFPPGMVRCGACGSVAEWHKNRNAWRFICRRRHQKRSGEDACVGSVSADDVLKKVASHIAMLADLPTLRQAEAVRLAAPDPEIARTLSAIEKAKTREELFAKRMASSVEPKVIEAYAVQFEKAVLEGAVLNESLRSLQAVAPVARTVQSVFRDVRALRDALLASDMTILRAEMAKTFARIELDFPRLRRISEARAVLDRAYPFLSKARIEEKRKKASILLDAELWQVPDAIALTYAWGSPAVTPRGLLDAANEIAAKLAQRP